jgi:hypothetical protein
MKTNGLAFYGGYEKRKSKKSLLFDWRELVVLEKHKDIFEEAKLKLEQNIKNRSKVQVYKEEENVNINVSLEIKLHVWRSQIRRIRKGLGKGNFNKSASMTKCKEI